MLIVDGRPTPTVKFDKDGNEVGSVTIGQPTKPGDTNVTAVFRVPKVTADDQGEYQASVENPAGVVKTKKAKVTVQQAPVFLKAPTDASVSQGKDVTYEAQLRPSYDRSRKILMSHVVKKWRSPHRDDRRRTNTHFEVARC